MRAFPRSQFQIPFDDRMAQQRDDTDELKPILAAIPDPCGFPQIRAARSRPARVAIGAGSLPVPIGAVTGILGKTIRA